MSPSSTERGARGPFGGHGGPPWARGRGGGLPVFSSLLVALIQLAGSGAAGRHQTAGRVPLDAFGYLLLVAGPALLVLRRRRPVPVVAGTAAVTLVYLGTGYPYGPVFASFAVAYCTAVWSGHRRAAVLSLLALYSGHLLLAFAVPRAWLRGAGAGAAAGRSSGSACWRCCWPPSPNCCGSATSSSPRARPPGRPPRSAGRMRNGCGWPVSCTTSWRTASR